MAVAGITSVVTAVTGTRAHEEYYQRVQILLQCCCVVCAYHRHTPRRRTIILLHTRNRVSTCECLRQEVARALPAEVQQTRARMRSAHRKPTLAAAVGRQQRAAAAIPYTLNYYYFRKNPCVCASEHCERVSMCACSCVCVRV